MKGWMVALVCSTSLVFATEPLIFGAIATVEPALVKQRFEPLFTYLEERTGRPVIFASAPTYNRAIDAFTDGTYDLGWIGPSPYVTAVAKVPGSLKLLGALKSETGTMFYGVIVTRIDAPINQLEALYHKTFAFGSPHSTMSYFVPKYMLGQAEVYSTLRRKQFLGRHDKVLKQVIMGKADAGGVKASEAMRYSQFVKIIAQSEAIPDFAIVCRHDLAPELQENIQRALLELDDPQILEPIKQGAKGFVLRKDSDYAALKSMMHTVQGMDQVR